MHLPMFILLLMLMLMRMSVGQVTIDTNKPTCECDAYIDYSC